MPNQEDFKTNIQQDLRDARGLLEQAGTDEERRKYRKAAEIILIKTLRLDPDNEEAKILLQSVRGTVVPLGPSPSRKPQQPVRDDEMSFTATAAAPALFASLGDQRRKSKSKLFFGLILALALGGGLLWIEQTHGMVASTQSTAYTPARRTEIQDQPNLTESLPAAPAASDELPAVTPTAVSAADSIAPVQVAEARPASLASPVPAVQATPLLGKLAVSSSTSADIYQGDKYLGSTPATLQLPAGPQTLEYRHGTLRTVMTHEVKADETINVSVTFQTSVQINARPWARVFVDGAPRRELGQTPLSGVNVPIGGILVFENPNFTSKTHRVAENDTAIQVDFQ